jgi:hypothetical protein
MDATRINQLANEAMESIETDDAEDYAHGRCAIECVIEKAIEESERDAEQRRQAVANMTDELKQAQRDLADARRELEQHKRSHEAAVDAGIEQFELLKRAVAERDDARREVERLTRIETAARHWYAVQCGTMAALSPSGIAMRDALAPPADAGKAHSQTPPCGGQDLPRPGELCKCGRPAITVYVTERFGRVGYCGIPDGGRRLPADAAVCPCGSLMHLANDSGECPATTTAIGDTSGAVIARKECQYTYWDNGDTYTCRRAVPCPIHGDVFVGTGKAGAK